MKTAKLLVRNFRAKLPKDFIYVVKIEKPYKGQIYFCAKSRINQKLFTNDHYTITKNEILFSGCHSRWLLVYWYGLLKEYFNPKVYKISYY